MSTVLPIEGIILYFTETFTAGVIQAYQGEGLLEEAPLTVQDPLEGFGQDDKIFQEYDPPEGDNDKMAWKRSRPAKWWMSLLKSMKCVFCIQILGGLTLGTVAILILLLDFNSVDLCYDKQVTNWKALPRKIQAIIVTAASSEAYFVQLWVFFLVLTIFGWPMVKKLNLLSLNLLGAFLDTCYRLYLQVYGIYDKPWRSLPLNGLFVMIFLMNTILIGREIARNTETETTKRVKKTIKVIAVLTSQFIFGIPITFLLVYKLFPLYGAEQSETNRAIIAGALPLITAIPKVVTRLAAQRVTFLHPSDAHILLTVLNNAAAIVFRVMQAELTSLELYILLSVVHGLVDLLERLTIVIRDYFWYYLSQKVLKREASEIVSARKFRTPRSMRFVADMSIQIILAESTSLITAVCFIQLYSFMYNANKPSFTDMSLVQGFFIRIVIALAIDFLFNSCSFWLQMSYLNVAVVRVWHKKWHKHMLVGLIVSFVTMCYFTTHLFAVVREKHGPPRKMIRFAFNCSMPFTKF